MSHTAIYKKPYQNQRILRLITYIAIISTSAELHTHNLLEYETNNNYNNILMYGE